MTLEELRAMREASQKDMERRVTDGNAIEVIVGMGTCGIAAGGKVTLAAFVAALEETGLKGVTLKQTGCMGLCYAEPTVEVRMAGMPDTIYGMVDAETGTLGEHFDADFAPLPGTAGARVEPGHMAEWSWLLRREEALGGAARAVEVVPHADWCSGALCTRSHALLKLGRRGEALPEGYRFAAGEDNQLLATITPDMLAV